MSPGYLIVIIKLNNMWTGLKNCNALYKRPVWILFVRKIAFNEEKELVECYLGYEVAVDRQRNKWLLNVGKKMLILSANKKNIN